MEKGDDESCDEVNGTFDTIVRAATRPKFTSIATVTLCLKQTCLTQYVIVLTNENKIVRPQVLS